MKKVNVPQTDLYASTLVLGTDYFGSTVRPDLCMELMDSYVEAGGNVIDTAELYARWVPGGEHKSEKVIGEWLRDRGLRDQVILSTKGAHPNLDSMDVPRLSKSDIQTDLDGSLRRLGVERVDVYWLHRDSPGYPVEEILQSLDAFRQAGKIRYAGFSNWTQDRAEQARLAANSLGLQGFVASQNLWSLGQVNRSNADPTWAYIDDSFVHWHIQNGLAAFPYMAQASGYFRRMEQETLNALPVDAHVRVLFDQQENRERFERVRHLQRARDLTVNQIVLGYLTSQAFPVFPLVGPKAVADLEDSVRSVDTRLSAEEIDYLQHGTGA